MRYTSIYILILTIMFVSCGRTDNKKIDSEKQEVSPSSDSLSVELSSEHQNILGIWTNCATNHNGVIMTANVCKTIEFKTDNSGSVMYPSQEIRTFSWAFTDDILTVNLTDDKMESYRTLSESPFQIQLTEDSLGFDLELKSKNENKIYYLGRQK
ncbi:hypothetical protein [Olleya sp. Bg11-27]|uniref:hypothetical protein n=1 Tax=Olleya sp. Bg11-27 TaxID=2058135 RepID=UPI0012FE7980|nr:hypothetical protein [Olleya sp. Bg11-27]